MTQARTPHELEPPRRISEREHLVIAVTALLAGMFGMLLATMFRAEFFGALFLVAICVAYVMTLTILMLELIAAFSRPLRRPQFSLRSMLVFTVVWVVMLLLIQAVSRRGLESVFSWTIDLQGTWGFFIALPLYVLAWSWFLSFPAGLAYVAVGTIRQRPAPIFAHVFLTSALAFLTLVVLVFFFVGPHWPMACVLIMMCAALGFFIESMTRKRSAGHTRYAVVALLIALQNYLALAVFFSGLGGPAAG